MANQALTVIKIIKGAPCDDTYSDVIKFGSAGAQAAYFSGLAKYTFSNCSYQRVNNSVASPRSPLTCRIPTVADNVYDCNYVMFQNQAFGSKWFYAFIRRINYINPDTTEIEYEIDSYQTYQFDYKVKPCLVTREHWNTDNLGESQQAEPLEGMPCITTKLVNKFYGMRNIIVLTTTDPTNKECSGEMVAGRYSGCQMREVVNGAGGVNALLNSYAENGNLDAVVGIYQSPFSKADFNENSVKKEDYSPGLSLSSSTSFGGYVPKNKKLYNSPYCYFTFSNCSGQVEKIEPQLMKEKGDSIEPKFKIYQVYTVPNVLICSAANYQTTDSLGDNFDYSVEAESPPACTWSGNQYANWIATNETRYWINTLSAGLNMMTGIGGAARTSLMTPNSNDASYNEGNTLNVGMSSLGSLTNGAATMYSQLYEYEIARQTTTPILKGSRVGANFNTAYGRYGFEFRLWQITKEQAQVVDQFFDMYGYATNLVKIPNETGRENWNYVKTADVIIDGSMPVQDMRRIKNMYNTGVRFWHTTDVGNYSLSNAIKKEVVTDDVG